jgi:hypothetical protein
MPGRRCRSPFPASRAAPRPPAMVIRSGRTETKAPAVGIVTGDMRRLVEERRLGLCRDRLPRWGTQSLTERHDYRLRGEGLGQSWLRLHGEGRPDRCRCHRSGSRARQLSRRSALVGSTASHYSRSAAFLRLVDAILFPIIELDLVWPGCAFPCFKKRFEA